MAKVTTKLQVTIPKALADRYRIRPGDEIEWLPAGDAIRVVPAGVRSSPADRRRQLELFDRATDRQRERQRDFEKAEDTAERGWSREDLYDRGRAH